MIVATNWRVLAAAGALAMAAGAGWQVRGWRDDAAQAEALRGALAARVDAEARAHAADEAASKAELARLAAQRDRDDLARQLEDAANADDSGGGLPRARVERLRQR